MQKPLFQKIHLTGQRSFNILKVDRPYFIVPWHFHPEIEIMLITNGTGTRFVGDNIEQFGSNDLVVIGSNLTHVWKNSPEHYEEFSGLRAEARVILFREDCFGEGFFNAAEMKGIKNMLTKAERGLKFFGNTASSAKDKIITAYQHSELERFISLICILNELSQSKEYSILSSIGYVQNFMHLMFELPTGPYNLDPVIIEALDKLFILHADHEQNASTSTVRLAGSSGANPFACIAAGIACLWGPAHGGANEAALSMLEEIGSVDNIDEFIKQVKDKNSGVKLMGFGHRVYKNYDPRAKLMRETCYEVLEAMGLQNDRLFKLAMALEKIALEDEYFVSRKLYPNVDFYSGIVQRALGIPVSLFTGIFALARTVGWIAQWKEMISDPEQKIGRPRQLFVGATRRDVPPISNRG